MGPIVFFVKLVSPTLKHFIKYYLFNNFDNNSNMFLRTLPSVIGI